MYRPSTRGGVPFASLGTHRINFDAKLHPPRAIPKGEKKIQMKRKVIYVSGNNSKIKSAEHGPLSIGHTYPLAAVKKVEPPSFFPIYLNAFYDF